MKLFMNEKSYKSLNNYKKHNRYIEASSSVALATAIEHAPKSENKIKKSFDLLNSSWKILLKAYFNPSQILHVCQRFS